ncbi:hypothetical protein ACIGBL_30050 [Streptomyces sp. NPDC085614]|uniref:hypothetical protein n=1 Tax=Streptomyces sp. NPDC085614 TaxID=3365733 RepID=UPI0037D27C00
MGLDYSYEIITPARNVAGALVELAKLAPEDRRVPPLTVTLPGGDQVVVPFTSHFESEPVDCSSGSGFQLDTSITFSGDDAVRAYCEDSRTECDEFGRVALGYIYLTVTLAPERHPDFASLEFTAATSRMSRLFERSASVRATFTDLTVASGGVACLLDTESDTVQVCWLNGRPSQEIVPAPYLPGYGDFVARWRS